MFKLSVVRFKPLIYLTSFLLLAVSFRYLLTNRTISIPDRIQDLITLSLSVFIEAFPFLVLGSILAAVVNTYVSAHSFHKILPKNPVFKRATLSLLGFLFPVCECGNVPLARSFMIKGFKPSEAMTFLLAALVLNPITLWSTWVAFSFDSTIVASRFIATFIIANFIGYVLSLKKNEKMHLTQEFTAVCEMDDAEIKPKNKKARFARFTGSFRHEAFIMIKMLAFGALIAGIIQTMVPRDVLTSIGSNVVLSIIVMLLLAFLVSICATVDAFFALAFANTFTAGSIVSFLVFGPMIDIKMLALLKTTFTNQTLIIVSVISLLMSALTGLVVTYAF